jgi:hypothetical protein
MVGVTFRKFSEYTKAFCDEVGRDFACRIIN